MSKFTKYILIALGLNLLLYIILCLPVYFTKNAGQDALGAFILAFFVGALALIVQLIVAIVFLFGKRKESGKAMLLSIGIILLVGLSVCSTA